MPKLTVEDAKNRAMSYFTTKLDIFPTGKPYNCCESVLTALSEYLGIDSDLIPRIGTVFERSSFIHIRLMKKGDVAWSTNA